MASHASMSRPPPTDSVAPLALHPAGARRPRRGVTRRARPAPRAELPASPSGSCRRTPGGTARRPPPPPARGRRRGQLAGNLLSKDGLPRLAHGLEPDIVTRAQSRAGRQSGEREEQGQQSDEGLGGQHVGANGAPPPVASHRPLITRVLECLGVALGALARMAAGGQMECLSVRQETARAECLSAVQPHPPGQLGEPRAAGAYA